MAKYIFHSEKSKTTCAECTKLDGKVYGDINNIPKLPIHPNCRCWIETIEDKKSTSHPCDCRKRLEVIQNNIENLIINLGNISKSINNEIYETEIKIDDAKENNNKKVNLQKVQNKLVNLKEEFQTFTKQTKDLNTDILFLKDNANELEHTKEECNIDKELSEINKKAKTFLSEINRYSENLKQLKEDVNWVERAEALKQNGTTTGIAADVDIGSKTSKNTNWFGKVELSEKEVNKNVDYKQKAIEFAIGNNYNKILYKAAKKFSGEDTAGMLDIAHEKRNDEEYTKDAIKLKNWDDPRVASNKKKIKEKVSKEFKDYGFNIDEIPGYFFKSTSEPVQRLIQNEDFRNIIRKHKANILKGENFSGGFPEYTNQTNAPWLINKMLKENNFKNAFGIVELLTPFFDKEGNLHIKMFDTYDFNKGENILVEAGRVKMLEKELKPFFTIHDIIIKKEELKYFGL